MHCEVSRLMVGFSTWDLSIFQFEGFEMHCEVSRLHMVGFST